MNVCFTWILLCCCVIVTWIIDVQGCTYGESPDCVFPCNCADEREVCDEDTGHCTSQCRDGPPVGFKWSGSGCRVGNVASGKNTTAKHHYRNYSSDLAVEGNIGPNLTSCFNSVNIEDDDGDYWWMVDLGATHIIYSVTIFNRDDGGGSSRVEPNCGQAKDAEYCKLPFTYRWQTYNACTTVDTDYIQLWCALTSQYTSPWWCYCEIKGHQKLQDFTVYVSNSTDVASHEDDCDTHQGFIAARGNVTISCGTGKLARYVSVVNGKTHPQYKSFALCEVVVIGALAIDCRSCAENSNCHPLNGCQTCPPGKRIPDCKKDCLAGTYGQDCKKKCHCKPSNLACHVIRGICEDGCDNWWIPPTCSQNIAPANLSGSHVGVTSVNRSSVIVSFDGLLLENDELIPHYYYVVTITATEHNFTMKSFPIPHNASKEVLFDGLEAATMYHVQVIPVRVDIGNNVTEAGEATLRVTVTTEAEPTTTTILTTTAVLTTTTAADAVVNDTIGADPHNRVGDPWSVGVIVGVAVGLSLLVAGAVVFVMFMIRLKRRQKQKSESSTLNHQEMRSVHDGQENPGLERQATTSDSQRPVTQNPKPSTSAKPSPPPTATGASVAIYENEATLLSIPPIPLDNLAYYIEKQKQLKNPFNKEYQAIPTKEMYPCTQASLPENHIKNRFNNIKPYDRTRVILDKIEGDDNSDYINANYIAGYKGKEHAYVACQGPRPCTVVDMWRMIWQLNTNRIVMLTRESEGGKIKCDRYWPEQGGKSMRYGSVRVSVVHVEEYADFNVTRLRMQTEEEERTVYHFHFTSWFDKLPPEYAFPLLDFWHKVKSYDSKATGPLVVHCSAGVGRTGTYIALDYLLQQAEEENVVNVYGFVNEMRQQRFSMIQTRDQYKFVYEALLESVSRGHTIIPASDFSDTFHQWYQAQTGDTEQPDKAKGETLYVNQREYERDRLSGTELDRQYEMLIKFNPTYARTDMKTAFHKDNVAKNRDVKLVARDSKRPILTTGVDGCTDYINAVFVHSYRHSNGVMGTHMPLPDTVVDLWRLVLDHHVDTIIMLNHYDPEDQSQGKYWPDSAEEMSLGPIHVKLTGHTDDQQDIHTRDFTVANADDEHVGHMRVRQLCVLESAWRPGDAVPSKASLMCQLLEQLQMWQQQQTGQRRVIVHCLDGVERTGVFCACLHIIEKLRVEQEVDIYTSVKHIKSSRKQFITSKDQYVFLHEVVEEYIGQFANYANFL